MHKYFYPRFFYWFVNRLLKDFRKELQKDLAVSKPQKQGLQYKTTHGIIVPT